MKAIILNETLSGETFIEGVATLVHQKNNKIHRGDGPERWNVKFDNGVGLNKRWVYPSLTFEDFLSFDKAVSRLADLGVNRSVDITRYDVMFVRSGVHKQAM